MSNNINPFLANKKKEKTSIQFIIRKNGERYVFNPGITVETANWIDSKRWCREGKKYPEGFTKNEQIKKYVRIIEDVFNEFDLELITPTQKSFIKAVEEKIEQINSDAGGVIKNDSYLTVFISNYINSCDKTTDTYKNYKSLLNHLVDYESSKRTRIKFSAVDLNFYNDFRTYMLLKTYIRGEEERHYSKNYIGGLFKMITKFMNETAGEIHNNKNYTSKKFKKEKEEVELIYLSSEEIQKIYDLKITPETITTYFKDVRPSGIARKVKALNDAKMIFLVGCYTGLRVSDYSRVEDFNVENEMIRVRTQKTNKIVYIPMHTNLKQIMSKINVMNIKMSDQKLNDHVKELGLIAGIDNEIKLSKTEGGQIVTRTYKKHQLICTHTARRSFASNAYLAGIDIYIIKELLGHSKIETTLNYLKISEEENARRIANNPFFKGG